MVAITINYEGELHCLATHVPSGAAFSTDAPVDNQGKGESFSPTDLVAAALGSCILTTMGIVAQRLGVDIRGAAAKVEKEMSSAPPRRIQCLRVELFMPKAPDDETRLKLERAAHTCPVHKSLHPDTDAPITFHWGT